MPSFTHITYEHSLMQKQKQIFYFNTDNQIFFQKAKIIKKP